MAIYGATIREEEDRVQSIMNDLVSTRNQISIENLLNMQGEEENFQQVCDESFVEEEMGLDEIENDQMDGDDNGAEVAPLSRNETLKALSILKRAANHRGLMTEPGSTFLPNLQYSLRAEQCD